MIIILTNSINEIIGYSLLGDIDGGISIDETSLPHDFMILFKPRFYLYRDGKVIRNMNYQEDNDIFIERDKEIEELRERIDELESKYESLTQGAN